jgi:hypothetical protein
MIRRTHATVSYLKLEYINEPIGFINSFAPVEKTAWIGALRKQTKESCQAQVELADL